MSISLNGKRALVCGSTAGTGLAIAIGLVQAGAEVVLNGRTQARVDHALRQVRAQHPAARIIGIAADLSTEQGTQTLIERVPHTDILVNTLSLFAARPSLAVRLAEHYAEGMAQRQWGRLMVLGEQLAGGLGETLAGTGVTFDAVLPGPAVAERVVALATTDSQRAQ